MEEQDKFQQEDLGLTEEIPKSQNVNLANRKNIPIKNQIKQIEKDIVELKRGLDSNKKLSLVLKSELVTLEGLIKEKCNELGKCIIDDLKNFEKDLKRVIQSDKGEINNFNTQVDDLNEEKVKLQKEILNLQESLRACEVEIGLAPPK